MYISFFFLNAFILLRSVLVMPDLRNSGVISLHILYMYFRHILLIIIYIKVKKSILI